MNQPIIGSVQLNSQQDIDANLSFIEASVKQANAQGVHLVVLPENACQMGNQFELAERFDEISAWYANLAFKYQIFILAGTLPCPYRPNGTIIPNNKLRQVSQIFAPDGKRLARYDKIHLFKAEVADSTGSYDEGRTFEAGETTVVAQCDMANLIGSTNMTKNKELDNKIHSNANCNALFAQDYKQLYTTKAGVISVGMMVCFDLRFPALAQRLRQAGADLLTAPSAFTYQTGKAHWQLLLQARALDAQCMVVGSAQGGTHYGKKSSRDTWGHSTIVNANGEVIASTNTTSLTGGDSKLLNKNLANEGSDNEALDNEALDKDVLITDDTQNFALITAPFNQQQQLTWRQNLPIHQCHRLG